MPRLFCITLLFLSSTFSAFAWEGRVVDVADGDTITVEPAEGGDRIKVRLWGIDCPELNQPFGNAARSFISNTLLFKDVKINPRAHDRYGRLVADVYYAQDPVYGPFQIQAELIKAGLAWVYPKYCTDSIPCDSWKEMQDETAIAKQAGLWQTNDEIPPWQWRKSKKEKRSKRVHG